MGRTSWIVSTMFAFWGKSSGGVASISSDWSVLQVFLNALRGLLKKLAPSLQSFCLIGHSRYRHYGLISCHLRARRWVVEVS